MPGDNKVELLQRKLSTVTVEAQERALLEIINRNDSYIVDLNTGQLFRGVDSNSSPLDPPYRSKYYAEFKLHLNPAGVVDLKLTGAFYAGFYIDSSKFPIVFNSTDEKAGILEQKYGPTIFGLDQPSKNDLVAHLKDQIQEYYKSLLDV